MENNVTRPRVSISAGNTKMGAIPSISLPPVITCAAGCKCAAKCYAAKLCRLRPTVRAAYQRNLDILAEDPGDYWRQIRAAAATARFFRFHVSGDIPDQGYLLEMIFTAQSNPGTQFLAFTKQYEIVNGLLAMGYAIPANLKLIFSAWPGMPMDNPYRLPVANVIFRGQQPDPAWKICGGNCTECACQGVGCWELKRGESIAFYEH